MKSNVQNIKTQEYLRDKVNKLRVARFLKEAQQEAEHTGLTADAKLIAELLEYIEQGDSVQYRRMRKNLKLRKLRII